MREYLEPIQEGILAMERVSPESSEYGPTAEQVMHNQLLLLSKVVEQLILDKTQKAWDE